MSEVQKIETQNSASSVKMLRAMVGIGIISALLVVLSFEGTLPRVQFLKAQALEKAVFKVLPGTSKMEAFQLETTEPVKAYAGYDESGQLTGYAVEAAGQGYADVIRILYGYDPAKQVIVGFQVLESKETPGLGDKIEKDATFLQNFEALDLALSEDGQLSNKVVTVKAGEKEQAWQIDGITGATISSRAIGNIIGTSTTELTPMLYKKYKEEEQ